MNERLLTPKELEQIFGERWPLVAGTTSPKGSCAEAIEVQDAKTLGWCMKQAQVLREALQWALSEVDPYVDESRFIRLYCKYCQQVVNLLSETRGHSVSCVYRLAKESLDSPLAKMVLATPAEKEVSNEQ